MLREFTKVHRWPFTIKLTSLSKEFDFNRVQVISSVIVGDYQNKLTESSRYRDSSSMIPVNRVPYRACTTPRELVLLFSLLIADVSCS